jgi:hypothetical protein
MTRLLSALMVTAALSVAAPASAQDPVTRRPGDPARPAADAPRPAAGKPTDPARQDAPLPRFAAFKGREAWGTTGELVFAVDLDTRQVLMVDETRKEVPGTLVGRGDGRCEFRFSNCVYEGTVRGRTISGVGRMTTGPDAGKTWTFRVELVVTAD